MRVSGTDGQTYVAQLYSRSYALLIGNSDYGANWDDLPGVYQDVAEVKIVRTQQGFMVVNFNSQGMPFFSQPIINFARDEVTSRSSYSLTSVFRMMATGCRFDFITKPRKGDEHEKIHN